MLYVDPLFHLPSRESEAFRVGARNGHLWCHLWTEPGNEEELHALAQRIGLRRAWFQNKNPKFPHYDLTPSRRRLALAGGAIETDLREYLLKKRAEASQPSIP